MGRKRKSSNEFGLEEEIKKVEETTPNDLGEKGDVIVQGLAKISKGVKESVVTMNRKEIRFLVDSYYQTQEARIRAQAQLRAVQQGYDDRAEEDSLNETSAMEWLLQNKKNEEAQLKKMLETYAKNDPVGLWMTDIYGIGPVLSAALLAYIDIDQINHVNQIYSYAGLNNNNNPWLGKTRATQFVENYLAEHPEEDPKNISEGLVKAVCEKYYRSFDLSLDQAYDQKKLKDKNEYVITKTSAIAWLSKPPYNTSLKTICWKIGDSFLKQSGRENSLYGYKILRDRFEYENYKNENGEYKAQAEKALAEKNWSNKAIKKIYESGMLPPGHIWARCKRYATKMFLSHMFDAMYWYHYHKEPPIPYAIANGHVDFIPPEVDYKLPKYAALDKSKGGN